MKSKTPTTKKDLLKKLKALALHTNDDRNEVVCALIGHSRIQTTFFGYFYCGRCEAQLGDSLGSIYPDAEKVVLVGHNCKTCRANYKNMTWRDKLYAPDPFKKEKKAA
jgi:hypothetical protein